jgi:hypothetical protein
MLRRKHAVLVAALLADALALALASVPLEADGAEMRARVWGALTGALVAAGALTPGPLWCQLFGSVDAHRIELLSACTALAASGLAIGVWAQWCGARGLARSAWRHVAWRVAMPRVRFAVAALTGCAVRLC